MIKYLIALPALLFALAGSALAQQTTVYGLIDNAVRVKDGQTSLVSGSYLLSRLGVKASEDLGGGTKIHAHLEGWMDANTGAVGRTDRGFFNQEASITLESNFGSLTMGKTDASGSAVADGFAGIQNFGNFSFFPVAIGAWSRDRSNTVRYSTPLIRGYQLQVAHINESNDGPRVDTASVSYQDGKLGLILGEDRTSLGTYQVAGARYNFGFVNVGAAYGRTTGTINNEARSVTVSVPLPDNFRLMGAYRDNTMNGSQTKITSAGVAKSLSKRTTLMTVYQKTDQGPQAGHFTQLGIVHAF